MEALASTAGDLRRLARVVDDEQARYCPNGGRSLVEVIAQLASVEELYLARWQALVKPEAMAGDAAAPSSTQDPVETSLTELVVAFGERRGRTLHFLAALEQRDWGRIVPGDGEGAPRLRDQVQALVAHDNEHLNKIIAIREALEVRQRNPER